MKVETVTIIPADRMVAVNGEAYQFDFPVVEPLPGGVPASAVHAIQWDARHGGQVEVAHGPARGFAEVGVVEPYVKAWLPVRAAQLRAQATFAAAQLETHEKYVASHAEAMDALDADIAKAEADPGIGNAAALRTHHDQLVESQSGHEESLQALRAKAADLSAHADAAELDAKG